MDRGLWEPCLLAWHEAKAIAWAKDIPLVGVHHIEGHISANYIDTAFLMLFVFCVVCVSLADYFTAAFAASTAASHSASKEVPAFS